MNIVYILGVVFISSASVLFVFKKLSHPSIPAYIIAGIIGGFFLAEEGMFNLLQIGIAFVVFIFGAKLEPGKLKHGAGASALVVGAHITGLGIGFFGILMIAGFSLIDSIVVSAALVFSSSLTGTELSEKYATIELLYGRLAESIDVIHDMLAILLILILNPIIMNISIGNALAVGGGMLALSLFFRKFFFPWLFRASDFSEELMVLSGISMLGIMMGISSAAGISIVIGAFFAGLAFSYFPYNIELVESMESLKDFFAAVFFFTLGALVTTPTAGSLAVALLIVLVTIFIKPLLTAFSLMYYGYYKRTAYRCAMTIDQVSEFVLIIVAQAHIMGVVSPYVFQAIILATTVTMITTSYTDKYSEEIYSWLSDKIPVETPGDIQRYHTQINTPLKDHIILVGYDVQGSRIAEYLRKQDEEFVVIDINPEKLEASDNLENYIFKSAMDDDSWEIANYKDADLIISTPPQDYISRKVTSLDTDAKKVVRSESFESAVEFFDKGADYVMVVDLLASKQLTDYVEEVIHGDEETQERMREALLEDLRKEVEEFE